MREYDFPDDENSIPIFISDICEDNNGEKAKKVIAKYNELFPNN